MDNRPGSYALILYADKPFDIRVGKLGLFSGNRGSYVYCGSAFGPGGVAARVRHHRTVARRPHWHIDYLRRVTDVVDIWFCHDPVNREHDWTRLFAACDAALLPVPGFGASDCRCTSHLVALDSIPLLRDFQQNLLAAIPDHWTDPSGQPLQSDRLNQAAPGSDISE